MSPIECFGVNLLVVSFLKGGEICKKG